jgi:2-iminobutanoate/2-iminopropanoate deaminase
MSNIVRHGVHPSMPLSAAVQAGGFIFLSGQLPFGPGGTLPGGDIAAQTRRTMENIEAALAPLGAELSDIVKVTVFLTHAEDFAGFNEAYRACFPGGPPARTTVVAALLLDARIEIEAIAWKPD